MVQLIRRYSNSGADIVINPTSNSVTQTDWSPMVMVPGIYQYNADKYDLSVEGLYGIINVGVDGGWRIIYQSDISTLMQSIGWLIGYGRLDESLTTAQQLAAMKGRKLSLRCGYVAILIKYILDSKSIISRQCHLITAETPNNFDDGHVITEIYINNDWQLFDLPFNRKFKQSGTSTIRNLDTYFNGSGDNEEVIICGSDCDLSGSGSYQFATNVYYDMSIRTAAQRAIWTDRIYQIPGILHTDGLVYFYMPSGTESRQSWVEALSTQYRVVSYAAWLSMFY